MTPTNGKIALKAGYDFVWMLQGDLSPEIYGWVEKDFQIIKDTCGFYRTVDPTVAAAVAGDYLSSSGLTK